MHRSIGRLLRASRTTVGYGMRPAITGWNARKHPFIWTKPADQILAKINRKRKLVSETGH